MFRLISILINIIGKLFSRHFPNFMKDKKTIIDCTLVHKSMKQMSVSRRRVIYDHYINELSMLAVLFACQIRLRNLSSLK